MSSKRNSFTDDEVKYFISLVSQNKQRLFGVGGVAATSSMRKLTWEKVANDLCSNGGWPRRSSEEIKKKWNNLVTIMKQKLDKRNRSGEGAVSWNEIDEKVRDVLGRDNPKLVAIPGAFSIRSKSAPTEQIDESENSSSDGEEINQPLSATTELNSTLTSENKENRKRKRTVTDYRSNLSSQLNDEHEWARAEHDAKMEVLRLQAQYYRILIEKQTNYEEVAFNDM